MASAEALFSRKRSSSGRRGSGERREKTSAMELEGGRSANGVKVQEGRVEGMQGADGDSVRDGGGDGVKGDGVKGGGKAQNSTGVEPDGVHVAFIGEDVEQIPSQLVAKYGKIAQRLDLSFNRLSSLEGLGGFPLLQELILDNNALTDDSLTLPPLPHLNTLTLNKNQVEDTGRLLNTLLKSCPNLRYLSLLGNRACPNELIGSEHDDEDYQRYRYYVIYKLPGLMFLDSRPVSSGERREAQRVGEYMRVIRPSEDVFQEPTKKKSSVASGYTPLPESTDVAGQHRGVFGQCKYVYYGKHSEGNRFIRNNQL